MGTLGIVCALIGAANLAFGALCLIYAAWNWATSKLRARQTEPRCACCGQRCSASEVFCALHKEPREWATW